MSALLFAEFWQTVQEQQMVNSVNALLSAKCAGAAPRTELCR